MPTRSSTRRQSTKKTTAKPQRHRPAPRSRPSSPPSGTDAARAFVEATIVRGQAVEKGTPLPPGATHEIVGRDETARPILKRKRFSTY
jgi:hypothetical protein